MGHCSHVMQKQCDYFERYRAFSPIILSLKQYIGYMLYVYIWYLIPFTLLMYDQKIPSFYPVKIILIFNIEVVKIAF